MKPKYVALQIINYANTEDFESGKGGVTALCEKGSFLQGLISTISIEDFDEKGMTLLFIREAYLKGNNVTGGCLMPSGLYLVYRFFQCLG
ncbi:hypothetical protein D3C76_1572070 [compost metagenome]